VFARIATYTAQPSPYRIEQGISRAREKVLPRLKQTDGYEGAYFFVDRQSGKAISISLWESEEAMHNSEEVARALRDEIAGGLATQMVDVEHYEVAIGPEEAAKD
jgi:heme-degrading monooxygenase HmoA